MTKSLELAKLKSEERWVRAFAASQEELAKLAQEALAEQHAKTSKKFWN